MSHSLGAELEASSLGDFALSRGGCICLLELVRPGQAIVVNVSLTWQLSAGTLPICHLDCCWIHLQKQRPLFVEMGWLVKDWHSDRNHSKLTLPHVTFVGQHSSGWNNRGWGGYWSVQLGTKGEGWPLIRINLTACFCVRSRSRAKVKLPISLNTQIILMYATGKRPFAHALWCGVRDICLTWHLWTLRAHGHPSTFSLCLYRCMDLNPSVNQQPTQATVSPCCPVFRHID